MDLNSILTDIEAKLNSDGSLVLYFDRDVSDSNTGTVRILDSNNNSLSSIKRNDSLKARAASFEQAIAAQGSAELNNISEELMNQIKTKLGIDNA